MLDRFSRHGHLFGISVAGIGLAWGALWEVFQYATGTADLPVLAAAMHDHCSDAVGAVLGSGLAGWYVRGRYGRGYRQPLSTLGTAFAQKRLPRGIESKA